MKLTIKHKQIVILTLLLILLLLALAQGCGSENSSSNCTAPAGSKVTITPASQTISTNGKGLPVGGQVNLNWIVSVLYPSGAVMPKACVTISGQFAVPSPFMLYQFFSGPNSTGVAVNSGFSAQTDDFGQYTFSTLLSGGTGTWVDTIYVQSGTNQGNATVTLN